MRFALFVAIVILSFLRSFGQEANSADFEEEGIDEINFNPEADESTDFEGEGTHEVLAPDAVETTRSYRSEKISVRKFDDDRWKEIVGATDFTEAGLPEPKQMKPPDMPWVGPFLKFIAYVVIIGLVGAILYFVIKSISLNLKIKREELKKDDIQEGVENIEDVDIESLLARARNDGNFKVAIRLYYLLLLKKLHASNVISWKKDKTNRDYLSELFSKNFYFDEIRRLTNSYEEVWYGEHALQVESFERLSAQFETVYQKMTLVEKS
jgi:hypothetical protein